MVAVNVFPQGINSEFSGALLSNTPEELAQIAGLSDAGSYIKAALDLVETGGLSSDNIWVINLWPPGMVWLNGALITVFGANYAVAYALLLALLWALFFTYFAFRILDSWGLVAATLGLAILLSLGPFPNWIFDSGFF